MGVSVETTGSLGHHLTRLVDPRNRPHVFPPLCPIVETWPMSINRFLRLESLGAYREYKFFFTDAIRI